MNELHREGVIKFHLEFLDGPPPAADDLHELNAWRSIFRQLGLLGQDPLRYNGYNFGNLSRRLPGQSDPVFLISGTRTGHLRDLSPAHYARVEACDPVANQLKASGQTHPSSEALSHAILYQLEPEILWVMHLHSPDIFNCRSRLNLPFTHADAEYGTPEMAMEIERLASASEKSERGLLVMTGHQDGILAYGRTAAEAGTLVIETLATALQKS